MPIETRPPVLLRFGVFEVDLRAGELRKQGKRIKLQEQPFQVLAVLLQRPGEVVTRCVRRWETPPTIRASSRHFRAVGIGLSPLLPV
jgi:hypothetical protein